MTVQQWRNLRWNRWCRYCVHAQVIYGQDGSIFLCRAKDKFVCDGIPRWFCLLYKVKEDI